MPPQLVIADSAFKKYPGGVIALRCSDWMAGTRGTLTSGADLDAPGGFAVHDEQKIAGDLTSAANRQAMHEAADDTLVIDLSELPIEIGMRYQFYISFLAEGNWNTNNVNTFKGCNQFDLSKVCALSWYGDFTHPTETSAMASINANIPRLQANYMIGQMGTLFTIEGNEILHIRAYSQEDTTGSWNLAQIYLMPQLFTGTVNGWGADDFIVTGTNAGISVPDTSDGLPEDGDDGGDDNGKFTRMPLVPFGEEILDPSGFSGGGDYQQKSSDAAAEYMTRILPDDFWSLWHSQSGAEVKAHAYSVNGPLFRYGNQWVTEDFDRTLGPFDWGSTPEGFGWGMGGGVGDGEGTVNWFTDGDLGVIEMYYDRALSFEPAAAGGRLNGADGGSMSPIGERAYIQASDHIIYAGVFRLEERAGVNWQTDGNLRSLQANLTVGIDLPHGVGGSTYDMGYHIIFRRKGPPTVPFGSAVDLYEWELFSDPGGSIFGPVDISSWFDWGADVGFLIEIRRYTIRVKVWDGTLEQPATFDYEDFRRLSDGSLIKDYPYTGSDLSDIYTGANRPFQPYFSAGLVAQGGIGGGINIVWTSVGVGSDHLNVEPGSITAYVEQPDQITGTPEEVGQIELPWGPWQMIYWGSRDWTTPMSAFPFDSYLDFATKTWVETGSSDLERAEELFWYFRTVHGGPIDLSKVRFRGFVYPELE